MKKLLLIIFFGVFIATILANTANTADKAAQDIINSSIDKLKTLHQTTKEPNFSQVKNLINANFLPFVDTKFSASQALKPYWNSLTPNQQQKLADYIVNSLIDDYAGVLISYKDLDSLKIKADPKIKQRDNLAIVALNITTNTKNEDLIIATKMIKTDIWRVYDLVVSGVSLIKTYEQQFNSYIKRKGFDEFAKRFLN
jgi:phospholipid transport system substrate-binding protein